MAQIESEFRKTIVNVNCLLQPALAATLPPLSACHRCPVLTTYLPECQPVYKVATIVSPSRTLGNHVKADNYHISTFPINKISLITLVFQIPVIMRLRQSTRPWSDQVSNNLKILRCSRQKSLPLYLISCIGCNYFALERGTRAEPCLNHYKRPRTEQPSWYGSFVSFSSAWTIRLKYQLS